MKDPWNGEGPWLRCALHAHTTNSDGEVAPRTLVKHYERAGYDVQVNRPYAGGFITEHYGNPGQGVHALQVEINRALYLDEATFSKTRHFDGLARTLLDVAARVFEVLPLLIERRAAAE